MRARLTLVIVAAMLMAWPAQASSGLTMAADSIMALTVETPATFALGADASGTSTTLRSNNTGFVTSQADGTVGITRTYTVAVLSTTGSSTDVRVVSLGFDDTAGQCACSVRLTDGTTTSAVTYSGGVVTQAEGAWLTSPGSVDAQVIITCTGLVCTSWAYAQLSLQTRENGVTTTHHTIIVQMRA